MIARLAVAACALLLPLGASAQAPKTLTITRDLLIAPEEADLASVQYMAVSRRGQIVVPQRKQKLLKAFGPNGGVSIIGRSGGGPGEFQNPTRIGFIGDSLWALDPSLSRVSIFGPDLKYVRGFPQPLSLGLERNDLPIAYSTQAVLPGGDLRAAASFRPTSPRPSWAAGVDSGAAIIVRIAPSGEFKKRLLARPLDRCIVEYRYAKGSGTTGIPFCPSPLGHRGRRPGRDPVLALDRVRACSSHERRSRQPGRDPGDDHQGLATGCGCRDAESEALPELPADPEGHPRP
ncbi:MAG: hypothetical protein IPP98_10340 [Gemmatimonadetes bacterium]|nr:hypothetical protein [Gemmatimonadota bacterium]